ncbi:MAG: hypothetical protein M3619_13885 [Myxococcota bacterium]|nr:hypothetical protein [Myxococcota bacterium]
MRRIIYTALLVAAVATGCAGSGTVGYQATYAAPAPDLVYVSPGVQVIADYDEPIFYSDSYYWRFYGGTWYRSHTYTGGWVYARPPRAVISIDRPYAYARYRPNGYVSRRYSNDRGYRQGPAVRDHRYDQRPYGRPAPAPQRGGTPIYDRFRDNRTQPPRGTPPVYDNRAQPQRATPIYDRFRDNRAQPQPQPQRPGVRGNQHNRADDRDRKRERPRDHR